MVAFGSLVWKRLLAQTRQLVMEIATIAAESQGVGRCGLLFFFYFFCIVFVTKLSFSVPPSDFCGKL